MPPLERGILFKFPPLKPLSKGARGDEDNLLTPAYKKTVRTLKALLFPL